MATDLELVRALRADDVAPTDEFLAEERARLMHLLGTTEQAGRLAQRVSRRARRASRRRWVAVPVAAVLLGGTAVYAATRSDGPEPTRVTCQFDSRTTSVVDAVSGDPTEDCRALWEQTHDGAAPALRAYKVGDSVLVLRAEADPPAGAVELDTDGSSEPPVNRAGELDAWLHDYASGLWSEPCIPYDVAVGAVTSKVAELGLDETWTVAPEPPGSRDACGLGFLDPDSSTIVVRGVDLTHWTAERTTPGEVAYRNLGHAVAGEVGSGCLTATQATTRARDIAASLGFPDASIRTIIDPAATCSRATVTVAGSVNITVYGPDS
jgi:hypothetical protein